MRMNKQKISNELTQEDLDNMLKKKKPPLRKPIDMAKNLGAIILGGIATGAAAISRLKPRTDPPQELK